MAGALVAGADGAVVAVVSAAVASVGATVLSAVPPGEHAENIRAKIIVVAPTAPGILKGLRER